MNVLKNNYRQESDVPKIKDNYPKKLVCEKCNSELEYDEFDIDVGCFGCGMVVCPCCGHENFLDDGIHDLALTADNVEFPKHFYYTSAETGAVDVCNTNEIRKYLREAISYFRKNKDAYDWGTHITGNLYLHIRKWDGDEMYEVTVSNSFYTTELRFEAEDY